MSGTLTPKQDLRPTRWWEPGRGMWEEMEHLMTRLWDGNEPGWLAGRGAPLVDITETETALEARADLPGVKPDEMEVQLNGNVLTISGERQEEQIEKGTSVHRLERRRGSFSRSISLPCTVQEDEVVAAYHDGVLTITMPKTEDARTRKITVKT